MPKGNRDLSQGLLCTLGHLHWMEKCRQPNVFQFGWGLITEPTELLSVFAFVPVMKLWLVLRKPSFVSFCNTQTIPDKKQTVSQAMSEAVNEMKLCGKIGVRLFLLNKTLCWFSPWELMKADFDLVIDCYSFWILNHKCQQITICDTLALLARLVNKLLATEKVH